MSKQPSGPTGFSSLSMNDLMKMPFPKKDVDIPDPDEESEPVGFQPVFPLHNAAATKYWTSPEQRDGIIQEYDRQLSEQRARLRG